MHLPSFVSESISPAVPMFFFGAIGLGVIALVVVRVIAARPRGAPGDAPRGKTLGRSIGLAVGWIATVAGALLIVMLATTRGGAPHFMYVAAALPLLAGIRILQICRRGAQDDVPGE